MTEQDANRILLVLAYNYAAFLPQDASGAAIKKGTWLTELRKYDAKQAEEAVKGILQTSVYPPTLADFRSVMAQKVASVKQKLQIDGPTWTPQGIDAMYTADMERVNRLMEDLDKELAAIGGKETGEW